MTAITMRKVATADFKANTGLLEFLQCDATVAQRISVIGAG